MVNWVSAIANVNGIDLHYWRTGTASKPIVLCAHGLTDSGECWRLFAEECSDEYEFILPDSRGHGASSAPNHGYSTDDLAADLVALLDALEIEKVFGIGHSMGGTSVALLAAQHPERIHAAILEDPAFRPAGYPADAADFMTAGLQREQSLSYSQLIEQAKRDTPSWDERVLHDWAVSKLQARLTVYNWLREPATPWREYVAQIRVPTLIITGEAERGAIIDAETGALLTALLPTLQIEQIQGAGHCVRYDQPAAFAQAVQAFLHTVGEE